MTGKSNKKMLHTIILGILIFAALISSTGCSALGDKTITGKYINEINSQVYLKFNKDSEVTIYVNNNPLGYGQYEIDKKTNYLSTIFVSGEVNGFIVFLLHDKDKSISAIGNNEVLADGTISGNFIKEKSFWDKHWLKILIVLFIIGTIQQALENRETLEKIMKVFLSDEQFEKARNLLDTVTGSTEEESNNGESENDNDNLVIPDISDNDEVN